MYINRIKVPYGIIGLVYKNGKFERVLEAGTQWLFNWNDKIQLEFETMKTALISTREIEQLAESPLLKELATFVDLQENERALVWIDGRFADVLGPGLYGYWTQLRKVKIEKISTEALWLKRKDLPVILKATNASRLLQVVDVLEGRVGLVYVNGAYTETLGQGQYAFWRGVADVKVRQVEIRDQILDINAQDIMTKDKVTLRLNSQVGYRVIDPRKAVELTSDTNQAVYREAQLALRSEVGARNLDALLTDKENLAESAQTVVAKAAARYGVEVYSMGIRDVILPGDMKDLMNQVIEAQKASEANAIKRREETAAMRSQMNTAKLIETSPTLMKLRELEVLEAVAKTTNLSVVLGDEKLTERLTKLI